MKDLPEKFSQMVSFENHYFLFTGRPANCAEQHRPQTNDDIVCEGKDKDYLTWFAKHCPPWQNVLNFCFPSEKEENPLKEQDLEIII